jgi:TonB-dependent receptor
LFGELWRRCAPPFQSALCFAVFLAFALLPFTAHADNGTWTQPAGGDWSNAANWQSGTIASGVSAAANFDTLNVSGIATVNLDVSGTVGSLVFGDTDIDTEGNWLITGAGSLTLDAAAVPSINVVLPTEANATLDVPVTSAKGFTKTGAGVLVLSSTVDTNGAIAINEVGSVLSVVPGGSLKGTSISTANVARAVLRLDGGLLDFNSNNASVIGNNGNGGFTINSGTAYFLGGGGLRTDANDGSSYIQTGGEVITSRIESRRDQNGADPNNKGFSVRGGKLTTEQAWIGTNNSWGHLSVEGGEVIVSSTFIVSTQQTSGRGGAVRVTAGRLTVLEPEYGLVLGRLWFNASSTNANQVPLLLLTGGITTISKISFGFDETVSAGSGTVSLSGSAALYLGAGGMEKKGLGQISTVTLTSGTLGADDSWTMAAPIMVTLPAANSPTIRAADEYGVPHDITIDAMVSGAGGFTKTGGGMLILSATNNSFGGPITLLEGGIHVTGQLAPTSELMAIPASTAFGGSGTVSRSLNYAAGSTLLVDVDEDSGAMAAINVTGGVNLGSTLTVKPIIPKGAVLQSGVYPIIKTTMGVTGNPTVTWDYVGSPATVTFARSGDGNDYVATVNMAPFQVPVITSALAVTGTESIPFSYTITADNWALTYEAEGLPEGLVIDRWTGEISGMTTFYGTVNVTIKAENRAGFDTKVLVLTMNERIPEGLPVITSATSANGTVDLSGTAPVAFNYQITASNPRIWGYDAAPLPAGLSLDPVTGLISGTLASTGTTVVTLSATNMLGVGTADLALSAWAVPVITSPTTAMGMIDTPFSYQITADNNPVSFNWGGFSDEVYALDRNTGVITTTHTAFLVTTGSVSATNPAGTSWMPLEIMIDIPQPRILSELVVVLPLGQSVDYQTVATRNPTLYHANPVPEGFTFDENTGRLTGTPTEAGTLFVELVAENEAGPGVPAIFKIVTYGPAPSNMLTWSGSAGLSGTTGVTGTATWDPPMQNWRKGSTPAAYADGEDLYFDDSSNTERIMMDSGTYTPNSMTFNVSGRTLTVQVSGSAAFGVSGTAEMRIQGTGTVAMAARNDRIWAGVTRLISGVYEIGASYSGQTGTPGNAGPLMFEGGSLLYTSRTALTFASYIVVPSNVHALMDMRFGYTLNSNLEGSGTLEIRNTSGQSPSYQFSGENFTGDLVLSGSSVAQVPRTNSWNFTTNLANLTLTIEDEVLVRSYTHSYGDTIYIGALAGSSPAAVLNAGANGPVGKPNSIFRIGRKDIDTSFAGSIGDWVGSGTYVEAEIVKEGKGMLTLSGSHNYIYGTTVTSGAIRLTKTGRFTSTAPTAAITVNSGAAFGGAGVITPDVTFQDGAVLLIDADPETGELAGPSVSGLVRFGGGRIEVRPVVTGTDRIANGVYTVLFSENDFVSQPQFAWLYPDDPAIQAQLEYVGNNRVQVTITGGAIPMSKFTSGSRAAGIVGQSFTYTATATSDDASPTVLSVENLPDGLVFDPATGIISGTPTTFGIHDGAKDARGNLLPDHYDLVLINATNSSGTTTMELLVIIYPAGSILEPPVITSPTFFPVIKSRRMEYQITASGFPTRFTATGLPNGVTVDADGLISGIPELLATYQIPITASNLVGTGSATVELKVSLPPPVITSPLSATAIQHSLFTYQIEALNEPSSYRLSPFYETTDPTNPTGGNRVNYVTIDGATGLISGTFPNVATSGTAPLLLTGTIFASNDTGSWGSPLTITLNPPEPVVTSGTQFFGVVGVPFTYLITASNMWPAYKPGYGVTNIPQGLNVTRANGEITGTPYVAGEYDVALVATNITGAGAKVARFTINGASSLGTLAGESGLPGATDGTATEARFNAPQGGIADKDGNLYVADTDNGSIRKIASDGTVSTLATGLGQPSAAVIDAAGTALYVADAASNTIKKVDTASGAVTTLALTGAPALNTPHGLVIDAAGNLYVADTGNNLIRKIDTATGTMTTVAGTGVTGSADGMGATATFDMPMGIALSADGARLFVADTGNSIIRDIVLATGGVTTLAGTPGASGSANGVGSEARFNTPEGLAVDASGVLYVADTGNHIIRSIDVETRIVITFAGKAGTAGAMDGNASNSLLNSPGGLTVDSSGEIYVFDTGNHTVRALQIGPAIVTPPADRRMPLNSTATFTVVASGGPLPTYQWYKDELVLPGATDATLTIESVQLSDVANYRVIVTNPLGFRSASAWLTIADATPNNPDNVGAGGGDSGGGGGGAPSAWYLAALALIALMYRFRRRAHSALLLGLLVSGLCLQSSDLSAQAVRSEGSGAITGSGVITGRVLNKATNQYLSDAIVVIEGTTIQAVTDSNGVYRLENVPVGSVRLSASYAGLDDMTREVSVPADGSANADFDMTAQVYLLDKFVVAGDREGSSRALQEQRVAITQKAVFAADSFGNVVDNNIGELMKNLPGITIDYDGEDASTMRIRGMDPEFASITVDGNDVASIGSTDSRSFNLQSATLQNIEKIEINAAPTADQPANTMGGQINIVTKSALRHKGRQLFFVANMSLNTAELDFDKTPGGGRTPDRKLQPGFNLSWGENFSGVFAFALDVGFTRKYRYNNEYTMPNGYSYDTFSLAATQNIVTKDTTGNVNSLQWRERSGSTEDRMISLNFDYEPWGTDHSFFLKTSYNDTRGLGAYSRYMRVAAGSHDPASNLYDMISPNGVSVNMENNVNASDNRSYSFNGGGKHRFGRLNLDYNAYYSRAETDPSPDDNYTITYSTRGLGMNIFNIAGNATGQIVQTMHAGQGVITPDDPRSYLNLANYDRLTLSQNFNHGIDEKLGAKFNAILPVSLRMPFTSYVIPIEIKAGVSYAEQSREQSKYWRNGLMTGGSSEPGWTTAQPSLGQFADPYFRDSWGFDVPIPSWVSPYLVNDYYLANPDAFYVRQSDDTRGHMQTYQEMIAARQTTESTSSAYAQLTFQVHPTFTVIAGLRYEVQRATGWKPEFLGMRADWNYDGTPITTGDTNIYSTTNALGQRNPSREKNQVPHRDPDTGEVTGFDEVDNPYYGMYDIVDQTAALFDRIPFAHTFDGKYFPNIQFKWTTPIRNLTLRGARTVNIGRPRLNQVLADTEYNQGSRRVTTGNPQLNPSSSVKYDLALDYSTSRDGEIRFSLFQQDIKDYIHEETSYFEITDLIEQANNIDIFYSDDLNYFPVQMRTGIWTQVNYYNSGRGKNNGFEISYTQRLDIIHKSLQNFRFYGTFSYANPTVEAYRHTMRAPSSVTTQTVAEYNNSKMAWVTVPMAGIQKRSGNVQLSYTGRRINGRIAAYWVDNFARNVRVDPYLEITEQNSYVRFDLNFTYKINSRWNATFDWRNMTDVGDDRKIYDRTGGYFTSGMVMNVGLRATY